MSSEPTIIADNVVVKIEYTLTVDGEVVDSSAEEGPLEYLHGHQNIVEGLEKALTGKKVGEAVTVVVPPEQGYGAYDDDATAFVDRLEMPAGVPLEEGVEIVMEDEDGDYMTAYIAWVGADEVELDFNHPLAGETLNFEVEVIGLRQPTEEELDHGHVHDHKHGQEDDDHKA
jgi:FKBP-type peptidyl-prolyl cis-trans isomerase SlyD